MSRFDWDPVKAEANRRKHGVTFAEAQTVDLDPFRKIVPDPFHDTNELRYLMTGHSTEQRLIVVVTSEGGPRPRIITARRATKRERHA